jgi:chromosomal replication initiation ATPase DnaA
MLQIVEQVAFWHDVTVADIMGRGRWQGIVIARRDAIVAIVKLYPQRSYPEVGRLFGLDHTSIIHAVQMAGQFVPRLRGTRLKAAKFAAWRASKTEQPAPMQAAE